MWVFIICNFVFDDYDFIFLVRISYEVGGKEVRKVLIWTVFMFFDVCVLWLVLVVFFMVSIKGTCYFELW